METGKDLTPVFLLTGFLGSGKTTLLNALLKAPEFANTAVVVNEFGEIGLDHFLIERSQDNVVLLEAGCLCCTISDSLHETLAELNARRVRGEIPAFTRVVIETTGLADPAPIVSTLLGNRLVTDHYRLDAVIVTVDAQHVVEGIKAHPEVAKQIAVADRLVLTKADLAPPDTGLFEQLKQLNPVAPIITSTEGAGALQAFAALPRHRVEVFGADVQGQRHKHAHHGHEHGPHEHGHDHAHQHEQHEHGAQSSHNVNRHDAHIRAHCLVIGHPASWAGIAAWWRLVSTLLGDRLLRCKGIVRIEDTGEIVFLQGVQRVLHRPERLAGWPDADHRSRLVCISRDVDEAQLRATLFALDLPVGSDPETALIQFQDRKNTP